MNIEEFREYCLSKKGATESTPFPKHPDILVFKVMGKMFTATSISDFDAYSIKCDPVTIEELRDQYDALVDPTYFSKKHWCQVINDGSISDQLQRNWIDTSYQLVVKNLTKKLQQELIYNYGK